jgi:hypothetical protein
MFRCEAKTQAPSLGQARSKRDSFSHFDASFGAFFLSATRRIAILAAT